jgi:hypothetical protein
MNGRFGISEDVPGLATKCECVMSPEPDVRWDPELRRVTKPDYFEKDSQGKGYDFMEQFWRRKWRPRNLLTLCPL